MLGQGSPERLASASVTASLFGTLGVSPGMGRISLLTTIARGLRAR